MDELVLAIIEGDDIDRVAKAGCSNYVYPSERNSFCEVRAYVRTCTFCCCVRSLWTLHPLLRPDRCFQKVSRLEWGAGVIY